MYLDALDDLLRAGASALSGELRARQRRFVLERQHPDGGWGGRLGGSDLYYTDFALRILSMSGPVGEAEGVNPETLAGAARFVAARGDARGGVARDVVDWFNGLNAERMLRGMGESIGIGTGAGSSGRVGIDYDYEHEKFRLKAGHPNKEHEHERIPPEGGTPELKYRLKAGLPNFMCATGGFARSGGGGAVSAYATFLAALALEMMEAEFPEPERAVDAIQKLKRPDGGYADLASGAPGQTSATAAAVAFLVMRGALTTPEPETVDFLLAMQTEEGGFKACADAPESDLLSTFTALVSLFALDAMQRVNLGAAVRWISGLAGEDGGFRAAASDLETDIEYTYYGLGALALVRAYVGIVKGFA